MDNQHRKIKGYRDLSQEEVDLMNEAKTLEARCLDLRTKVLMRIADQEAGDDEERLRVARAEANRWAATAKTDIERGFMALVRAIAQPQPMWTKDE